MRAIKYIIGLFFLSVSVFLLIVAQLYDVDVQTVDKNIENLKKEPAGNVKLDDKSENLFHFVQISDLHISKFKEPTRISDFRKFCSEGIDIIKPKIVCFAFLIKSST